MREKVERIIATAACQQLEGVSPLPDQSRSIDLARMDRKRMDSGGFLGTWAWASLIKVKKDVWTDIVVSLLNFFFSEFRMVLISVVY